MNFIKSVQFKKLDMNIIFPERQNIIKEKNRTIFENFILFKKVIYLMVQF